MNLKSKKEFLKNLFEQYKTQERVYKFPNTSLALFSSPVKAPLNSIDIPCISIILSGQTTLNINDCQYTATEGTYVATLYPNMVNAQHGVYNNSSEILVICTTLDINALNETYLEILKINPSFNPSTPDLDTIIIEEQTDEILDVFVRLVQISNDEVAGKLFEKDLMKLLYYLILNSPSGYLFCNLLKSRSTYNVIADSAAYIKENINQPLTSSYLAKRANMSQSTFYQQFKQIMKQTPLQHIKLVKMNYAHQLLMSGHSVTDTSFSVGYNSISQFSREFKSITGQNPSAVKQNFTKPKH